MSTLTTCLYSEHVQKNAKIVDFHGWQMPLHYGSPIQEHLAVRQQAGIFDVSHMTIIDILGPGGRQFLRHLLTNDVDALPHSTAAMYSCMCHEHGGILDDLIVYQRSHDSYRLILNAATKEKDFSWIQEKCHGYTIGLHHRPDLAIIAVQGPQAIPKLSALLSPSELDGMSTLKRFECLDIGEMFLARTGYTGEDGLEIMLPHDRALTLWQALLAEGFTPCGLAARDSLRLEAGYRLYGQDMDETTTPFESGLGWTVKLSPDDRDFIGKGALLAKKAHTKLKMVGLTLEANGVMRAAQRIIIPSLPDGIITSGGYSPSLGRSIALARIPIDSPELVEVEIRGKRLPAKVGPSKFIQTI